MDQLCLAGGVAHNCTLNGKLLRSGLFRNVYVQPAAHDGGLALGAALFVSQMIENARPAPITTAYLGLDIEVDDLVVAQCKGWSNLLIFRRSSDIARETADLLARGKIVGWVQGRSEYGPRALGNRSIISDPRPEANRTRINAMVKRRESFRPFAPAVLASFASTYFDIPPRSEMPFMTFVVPVRPAYRAILGAVCHVDGTARVQTVSPHDSALFHGLITQFHSITGIPIILNTSFNNNAEPIIDSARDAIRTFLTTDLDLLVVGSIIISKKAISPSSYLRLIPTVAAHLALIARTHRIAGHLSDHLFEIRPMRSIAGRFTAGCQISEAAYLALKNSDGKTALEALSSRYTPPGTSESLVRELYALWELRLVDFSPSPE